MRVILGVTGIVQTRAEVALYERCADLVGRKIRAKRPSYRYWEC
jgi:hypothetical protein